MRGALHCARLDFLSIKPFLTSKNMLIYFSVPLLIALITKSTEQLMAVAFIFGSLAAACPFTASNGNGTDVLFATLPQPRRIVVAGRYLFTLTMNLLVAAFQLMLAWLSGPHISLFYSPSVFRAIQVALWGWVTVTNAFSLPFNFKLGYIQARFFSHLPLIVIIAVIALAPVLPLELLTPARLNALVAGAIAWRSQNLWLLPVGALLLAGLYVISYCLSVLFYTKREF